MRHIAVILFLTLCLSAVSTAQTPMDVQPVKKLVPNGTLATCGYTPVEREAPYFKQLDSSERVTGSFMKEYTIHGKSGKFVSWFGIVRGISKSAESGKLTLLLEQKYFDGLTDCHIMLVSQAGSGDFLAELDADVNAIPALSLMRIYGKVTNEKEDIPVVSVSYARLWPWLTFTFTDLGGEDKGNPRWTKFCKPCKGRRIYNPYPNESYYLSMLGDPKDFGTHLQDFPKP
ncbi:MAG TPA: hypothetical protein VJR23_15305 [Candidatus Acidoferrales bacterium]|nr:hypothetical protein [Candidatus Acidoferrales bacterium]